MTILFMFSSVFSKANILCRISHVILELANRYLKLEFVPTMKLSDISGWVVGPKGVTNGISVANPLVWHGGKTMLAVNL